ncbi:hypothetical protein [Providencia hangzhouensis]|uniref:hypothetical protein n=1 Tax=Providencia hangzhouensis TaxID=3031799 RepID=UPI0034DD9464
MDPPSRWDDGILVRLLITMQLGVLLLGVLVIKGLSLGITATGTMGTNIGAWRVRADWQTQKVS